MEIRLTLALPRDELSIPVVRRVLVSAMSVLGVNADCIDDVAVAVTEACTNVLQHAADDGVEYEVSVGIDHHLCVIEVFDRGSGFDSSGAGDATADLSSEQGRGIHLMRQMVDRVSFGSRLPEQGTIVHLEKQLYWPEGAPITRLWANGGEAQAPVAETLGSNPLG